MPKWGSRTPDSNTQRLPVQRRNDPSCADTVQLVFDTQLTGPHAVRPSVCSEVPSHLAVMVAPSVLGPRPMSMQNDVLVHDNEVHAPALSSTSDQSCPFQRSRSASPAASLTAR